MHPTLAALHAHFDPDAISWRCGPMTKDKSKTKPLAYIDARDVQTRLDDVLGFDWSNRYVPMNNGTACCEITVTVDGKTVTRSDGAELISDSDKPDQREMALKGSYSDAFKRAAVKFGVGKYLYEVDAPWIAVDEKGNIPESGKAQLRALLVRHAKAANIVVPIKPVVAAEQPKPAVTTPIVETPAPRVEPEQPPQLEPEDERYPDMDEPYDPAVHGLDDPTHAANPEHHHKTAGSAGIRMQLMRELRDMEEAKDIHDQFAKLTEYKARRTALWERMTEEDQGTLALEQNRLRPTVARVERDIKTAPAKRQSSYAAKRDGGKTQERFGMIRGEISRARDTETLKALRVQYQKDFDTLPARWADVLNGDYDTRMSDLVQAQEGVAA